MKIKAIILLLLLLLTAGCSVKDFDFFSIKKPTPSEAEGPTFINCGIYDSCFADQVKNCSLAFAVISASGTVYTETVKGYSGNYCLINIKYSQSPVKEYVGKEMDCQVPKNKLKNFREFLTGQQQMLSCQGSLIELIKYSIGQ